METEEKNQLKQSAQAIAEAMAKWENNVAVITSFGEKLKYLQASF